MRSRCRFFISLHKKTQRIIHVNHFFGKEIRWPMREFLFLFCHFVFFLQWFHYNKTKQQQKNTHKHTTTKFYLATNWAAVTVGRNDNNNNGTSVHDKKTGRYCFWHDWQCKFLPQLFDCFKHWNNKFNWHSEQFTSVVNRKKQFGKWIACISRVQNFIRKGHSLMWLTHSSMSSFQRNLAGKSSTQIPKSLKFYVSSMNNCFILMVMNVFCYIWFNSWKITIIIYQISATELDCIPKHFHVLFSENSICSLFSLQFHLAFAFRNNIQF